MMRCKACDDLLTTKESTRKAIVTQEYIDLCDKCFNTIADEVATVENEEIPEIPDWNDLEGE